MSLDSMPDDCLITIFNFINDPLILFRCLRVCRRWYVLISYRLARVEHLLDLYHIKCRPGVKSLCFLGMKRPLEEPILSAILRKTPKMKVICVGFEYSEYANYDVNWVQRSLDRLSHLESLKGLIITYLTRLEEVKIPENIEMLRTDDIYITTGYYPRVKQLLVDDKFFTKCILRFPNLVRLNLLVDSDPCNWFTVARNYQYLFKKLKIIEIDTSYEECLSEVNYACQFICLCPQAESAHIRIPIDQTVPYSHFKHENLKNLVITYVDFELVGEYYLNLLGLLKRFPNVKHLAIKYDKSYIHSDCTSPESDFDEFKTADFESVDKIISGDEIISGDDIISGDEFDSESESETEEGEQESSNERKKKPPTGSVIPFLVVSMLEKLVLLDMRDITGVDATSAKYVHQYCQKKGRSIKFYFGFSDDSVVKRDWPELFNDNEQDDKEFNFMKHLFLPDYKRTPFFLDPY